MDLAVINNKITGSKYFTWKEALTLSNWQVFVLPSEEVKSNIEIVASKMDLIRELIGKPIKVTSWYRPPVYNKSIGGAQKSNHIEGKACDFQVEGLTADQVRDLILPKLGEFNIRMEKLPGSNWVHIDISCDDQMAQERRYFKP